ncbi:MAG: Cas10/Cmr2 second palm domain-containing protein [Mediterraneibacter sp.]
MGQEKYILAMYDILGKQDYIYKSSKIKEIAGGSYIIRDCFAECLFPAAKEVSEEEKEKRKKEGKACSGSGIFTYKWKNMVKERDPQEVKMLEGEPADFTPENFKSRIEKGYIGEVVYDGGGNFFVLYRGIDDYRKVNRRFYRKLLEKTYSLRVLTTYIEGVDFDNYLADRNKMYAKHKRREQRESMTAPVNTLPIVQTDYRTSLPLTELQKIGDREEKVSYESKKKYEKYAELEKYEQPIRYGDCTENGKFRRDEEGESENQIARQAMGSRLLDNMITEKGEESLLAVIYIDGNNMGAKVDSCLDAGDDKSYETCVKALREFSDEIQTHYIDNRIRDVDTFLSENTKKLRRFVIYAGDEITFICNARNAYDVAKEYLTKLAADSPEGAPRTSCAGIAVFHSHAPFREAYRIAEECCESGKKLMKELKIKNASMIDFHYCQGAFGTSLEAIRKDEETEDCSRPWFVYYDGEKGAESGEKPALIKRKYVSDDIVQEMKKMLNKIGNSNIKDLAVSAKRSEADFRSELERISAHQKAEKQEDKVDFTLGGLLDDKDAERKTELMDIQRKLIYDMAIVYDIWFNDEKRAEEERKENEALDRSVEEGDV